jgi:hypothetical protein
MSFEHLVSPGNCRDTREQQIQQLRAVNGLLTGGDDQFDATAYHDPEAPEEVLRHLRDAGLKPSVQAEYLRVLIKALVYSGDFSLETVERYRQVRDRVVDSSGDSPVFDPDRCRGLREGLTIARGYRRHPLSIRTLAALFGTLNFKHRKDRELLKGVELADLVETRLDDRDPDASILDVDTGEWLIRRGCHGETLRLRVNSGFLEWVRLHLAGHRHLLSTERGEKYRSTSYFSRFLKKSLGLNYWELKRCLLDER